MMKKRRKNSIRKPDWHYGVDGYYFITICTHERECLFDSAEFKTIIQQEITNLPTYKSSSHVLLDEWIIMPNHLHLILVIENGVLESDKPATKAISGTIGALVGTLKSTASRKINNVRRSKGQKVWQRGYYDRIIRNERELNATRKYIQENPIRWQEDRDNLDSLLGKMTYCEIP